MTESGYLALRVARVVPEGRAGVTLVLDGALPAQPGQFVMAWLPDLEERPFSLMDDDPVSITVANVGPFSAALCSLRVGERLWVRGPFGHGFALQGTRHLLVGGGSGSAALTLLAKRAREAGQEVIAAVGARTAALLMLRWRFEELGCPLITATDDGSQGVHATVLGAVQATLRRAWPDTVYGCGPEPLLQALARSCAEAELPSWVSMERVMRCGIGVCGSCHCSDRLVCADGPVFPAALLLPAEEEAR
jgi:dihydroorotate dehydrogenase electron transfer subunit